MEVNRQNLRLIATLLKRLETSGLKDLDQRPIELGNPETDAPGTIVIGD